MSINLSIYSVLSIYPGGVPKCSEIGQGTGVYVHWFESPAIDGDLCLCGAEMKGSIEDEY